MQWIFKAAILAITGVLVAVSFRKNRPEYGSFLTVVLGTMLFGFSVSRIQQLALRFEQLKLLLGEGTGYLGLLLKVLGITYLCEFCADVCKDAGYQAIALQVELMGKFAVMAAGLPLFFTLVEQIQSVL